MRRLRPGHIALALLVGALPMLPAEHAHESEVDGHHELIVHRHSEFHLIDDDDHHQDPAGHVLDHEDGHTVTLNAFFTAPAMHAAVPPVPVLISLLPAPPMVIAAGPAVYVERLIHGPPRAPSGLRAPPVATRL